MNTYTGSLKGDYFIVIQREILSGLSPIFCLGLVLASQFQFKAFMRGFKTLRFVKV